MSSSTLTGGHKGGFGDTTRSDNWWIGPVVTLVVFMGFIVYTTWAAFQGEH